MMLLLSIIAFVVLITGLILIHEAGHFFAARKAKVVVEEFGFGLPPRAKTLFWWSGTRFTLNWIPFGGFVRLKGENDDPEAPQSESKGNFTDASLFARACILLAGVAMNFLLAFVIFVFGFSAGKWVPTYLSLDQMQEAADRGEISMQLAVYIEEVYEGGGAAKAGIGSGTVIAKVDDLVLTDPKQLIAYQADKKQVQYTLLTGPEHDQEKVISVDVADGKTGIALHSVPMNVTSPSRNIFTATRLALRETSVVTVQTVLGIAKLFTSLARSGHVPEGVTGIVGIAQLTYTSVQEGFMVYLRLVALLSLSLAVLNVLPFPALDGGRLLFVLVEAVFRTKDRRIERVVTTIGFVVLLLVMVIVTFSDVLNLVR